MFILGFFWITACSNSDTPLHPVDTTGVEGLIAPSAGVSDFRPGLESEFGRLALQFPAFAGYSLDRGGNLVIRSTDPRKADAIRGAVLSSRAITILAERRGVVPPTVLDDVEFSFLQLNNWRNRVSASLVALPGVTFVDLDEENNTITIGVENLSVTSTIKAVIDDAQIPQQALAFKVTGQLRTQSSLSDSIRPLIGGIEIHPSFCTFGFNAIWEGFNVWLTNSHCSDDLFSTDGGDFFQNGEYIGYEFHDPDPRECPSSFPYFTGDCRWSDMTIVRQNSGSDYVLGEIARTSFRGLNGSSGSTIIDPADPAFTITQKEAAPLDNERVDKIGLGSGWTSGFVTATCVDTEHENTDVGMICQYLADYGNGGGDSGSPVFQWSGVGNSVTLVGIHWAGFESGSSYFSPMGAIEEDLWVGFSRPLTVTAGGGGGGGGGGGDCSPEEIDC